MDLSILPRFGRRGISSIRVRVYTSSSSRQESAKHRGSWKPLGEMAGLMPYRNKEQLESASQRERMIAS